MAYNYSVDEETIPRKYAEHDWSNNVIISDSRMTSIEKGIVNLYNTIFGVEEEIDDNGETQVEKITSIFDDFKNTIIGDDLSGPHNDKIFDNIAKLWHNIEDESNLDENEQEISRTPYGRIVDLENNLGTKGTNQSAFTEINTIKSNLGNQGTNDPVFNEIESVKGRITTLETNLGPAAEDAENKNTAFDEINTIKTNLGTLNEISETSAFGHIKSLETNLGVLNTSSAITAFGHIKTIETNLGKSDDEATANTIFSRVKSLENKIGPAPQDAADKNTICDRMVALEETLEDTVREETDKALLKTTFKLTLPYLTASILTKEKEYKIRLLDINYPIGSIYMTLNNADPKNILGGKWIPISQGRVLLGAGNNISDGTTTKSFTVGSTGGEYNHKLIIDEMPTHNHSVYYPYTKGTETGSVLTRTTKTKRKSASDVIINKGGNVSHNNIQPYLVCNIWQRVIEDIHDVMRTMDSGTYKYLFKVDNEVPLVIDDHTTIIMVIDQIDTEKNYVYFRQKYTEGMEPCSNSEINDKLTSFQNSIPSDVKLALVGNPTLPTETTLDDVEVWATSNQGDTEAQHYLLPRICLKTIDMSISSNIVDAEDSGHSF